MSVLNKKHDLVIERGNVMDVSDTFNDGEFALINVETGSCYELAPNAYKIWMLLEKPTTLSVILENLEILYHFKKDEIKQDVFAFLNNLQRHRLIKITAKSEPVRFSDHEMVFHHTI